MAGRVAGRDAAHEVAHSSPLERLHAVRHRYGPEARAEKLALLHRLFDHPPRSARGTLALHDDLLFLRAFPDDAEVYAAALGGLRGVEPHVRSMEPAQRRALDDSGVAGSVTRHAFARGIAQWLVDEGEDADIDWDSFASPERLDPLLRLSLAQAEADAFDSGELTTREWLALARGGGRRGTLAWLLRSPAADAPSREGAADPTVARLIYESIEIPVRWRLTSAHATSGNAVDGVALHPRTSMRPPPADPVAHITLPLDHIERLEGGRAMAWLGAARAALAARCREVHAITYANLDEIWLADLGEGTALCLIGAALTDRLTLEANYGYVLFSNGVPVGYGGVTPLAAQANTGINVFDAFRHAEAAMLFAQALRAFRTLLGVTRFVVNPYQFGAGNDEALQSGAFWLYDRLGFRPLDPKVRAIAARERALRSADRTHRSSLATLRRLAAGDLVLELPGCGDTTLFEERWLVTLARAVTTSLVAADIPARLERRDAIMQDVADALELGPVATMAHPLRFGFQRLAPIVALVLDRVRAWPRADRLSLARLLAAKGSPQERDFASRSRGHNRLWRALGDRAAELESRRDA